MMSELNMSYGKLSDFVSFLLLEFTLIIKLRNFDFENHCNTLRFFGKKHDLRYEYTPWRNVCFVSFPLLGFTLVIKVRNVDSKSHGNTVIFFDKKHMRLYLNMPHGKMSDIVSPPLFRLTLVIKFRNFHFENY